MDAKTKSEMFVGSNIEVNFNEDYTTIGIKGSI